jgi:hypothetical protein
MNETRFKSLAELIAGTKDMKRDEVYRLASGEFSSVCEWKEANLAAASRRNPKGEAGRKMDYLADLKTLLFYMEHGGSFGQGKVKLIEAALKQWDQNAKPDSKGDADSVG